MMNKKSVKVMFTDMWKSFNINHADYYFEWRMMSKNWAPELSNDPEFLFFSCFGNEHLKYDCIKIFYTPENVRPNFNVCDYSFSYDYPITDRNYRLPLYRRWAGYKELLKLRDPEKIISENRKFCNILISNANAKERVKFFNLLSRFKKIDSGGGYLNNIGYRIKKGVDNKLNWMKNYKFSITFENSTYPGYTTERLMHALLTNTIPIYWGNPLASLDFNPKAFINCHDYASFEEVIELIMEIDNNDALYLEYLSQPFLLNNVETEFCREENIVGRFNEILSGKKSFISHYQRWVQKRTYFGYKIKDRILWFYRKLIIYIKEILKRIKKIFFRDDNITKV